MHQRGSIKARHKQYTKRLFGGTKYKRVFEPKKTVNASDIVNGIEKKPIGIMQNK